MFCLAVSASYHTFSCVSIKASRYWNQLDYLGIVMCVWGSFISVLHFGFPSSGMTRRLDLKTSAEWEQKTVALRRRYETMITTLSVLCIVVTLSEKFSTTKYRPFRAAIFTALGLSAVVPIIHAASIYGLRQLHTQAGLYWVIFEGVLYCTGTLLYGGRIPERYFPGKFDILGSSHQIFHICILFAQASHLTGMLKALDWTRGQA